MMKPRCTSVIHLVAHVVGQGTAEPTRSPGSGGISSSYGEMWSKPDEKELVYEPPI